MFKKILKFFSFSVVFFFFVSAQARLPNAVTMFFLPAGDLADTTSFQPTQNYKIRSVSETRGADAPLNENEGIDTPSGLSFVDGKTSNDVKNLLLPSKVLIFPPSSATKKKTSLKKTNSVNPASVQIMKLPDVKTVVQSVIEQEKKEKVEEKPEQKRLTPKQALEELSMCQGNVDEALTVLTEALSLDMLPITIPECSVYDKVASYLKKCHPYPVVYYMPTNAAVARRISVQKSVDLLTAHYSQKKCDYLDLSHVNFEKAEFYKSNLTGIDFSESYFNFATFMDGDFSNGIFKKSIFDNALIQNADFSGGYFKEARLKNAHFIKTNLDRTNFANANVVNTQFRDVRLNASDFSDADFSNTRFERVSAERLSADQTDFKKSVITQTLFLNLYAPDADFSFMVCDKCFFDGAVLKKAQFYKTFLKETSFAFADLQNSDFEQARFEKNVNIRDAFVYQANFKGTDLALFDAMSVEKLRQMIMDKKTKLPEKIPDFDSADYDLMLAEAKRDRPDFKLWECSESMCQDTFLGRATPQNLAVKAMTLLESKKTSQEDRSWAVCTISCLAKNNKTWAPSQTDMLATYLRRARPWSADMIVEKTENETWGVVENPLKPEEQSVLYVLMSLSAKGDAGNINLTKTDLRGADLSYADLTHIDFSGSNLSMADMGQSKVLLPYSQFDGIVFDEFTVFPQEMTSFTPYRKPYRVFPKNWPYKTMKVVFDRLKREKDGIEEIPYPLTGDENFESMKEK